MRNSTLAFWLVLVVVAAVWGWKGIGLVFGVFVGGFLLLMGLMVLGVLVVRRRMTRRMLALRQAIEEEQARARRGGRDASDVVDVDAKVR